MIANTWAENRWTHRWQIQSLTTRWLHVMARYKKASWQQWQTWILNMQVSCAALYSSHEWTKWVRTEAPSQMTDSWEIPKVAWSLQEDTSVSHCDSDVKAHPGVFDLMELPDPKMLFTSAELFIYFMYFFIYLFSRSEMFHKSKPSGLHYRLVVIQPEKF